MSRSNSAAVCLAGIAAIFIATFVLRSAWPINHDVSWYLYATEKWRLGSVLYLDIIEVNPPLAFWLTLPALHVGEILGVSAKAGMIIWILLLCAGSLGLSACLLKGMPRLGANAYWAVLLALALAMVILPGDNFGQREHFLVIFLIPYLLLLARRLEAVETNRSLAFVIGLWVAVGLCLKPHFFLVPAMIEAILLVRQRSWRQLFRPENMAIAGVSLAYACAIILIHPEFFDRMLPLGVNAYSPYYGLGFAKTLTNASIVIGAVACIGVLAWRGSISALGLVMLVAALAMLAIYFVQFKGFRYHVLPAIVFCALAAAWMAFERNRILGLETLVAVVLVVLSMRTFAYDYLVPGMIEEVRAEKPQSVFIATSNVFLPFPMVTEDKLGWPSRYPTQWLLPYAADMEKRQREGKAVDSFAEQTIAFARSTAVDDLISDPPQLVIVDDRKEKPYFSGPFDYLAFYDKDPRFKDFWSDYVLDRKRGDWSFYRRGDAPAISLNQP